MWRLGILGGTFDPPHIGHLILAQYTVEALELDHLFFVPVGDHPHKDNTRTPVKHRLAMVERAIAGNSQFSISYVDVERSGPNYSADTVRIIQEQHPNVELYFVMGGDNLRSLPTWKRAQDLYARCKLAVMRRSDEDIYPEMHGDKLPGLAKRVVMVDAPLLGIWLSSTHAIERLQQGKSLRYVVPDTVLNYIKENGLYKSV